MADRKGFRKKVRQPDEFLTTSEKVINWFIENPLQAAIQGGVLVLVVALAVGFSAWRSWRHGRIVNREDAALALYDTARDNPDKISEAVSALENLNREHSGTASADVALFQASNLNFIGGNAAKAQEGFRLLADKGDKDALLAGLARRNLAYALEQSGNLQAAAQAFEQLLSRDVGGLPPAQTLWDLARIYQKTGAADKAKQALQSIVDEHGKSPWADEAREKLGLPKAKDAQLGEL